MNEQEKIMDDLLNTDVEIIESVRELHREDWNSETLKQKVGDLLKVRDGMVEKLLSAHDDSEQCQCGHSHE